VGRLRQHPIAVFKLEDVGTGGCLLRSDDESSPELNAMSAFD
jgi:hypothetical protein